MTLRGRGIIITGGSQGLGRAVAEACVDSGADVFLCARRGPDLQETCHRLQERTVAGQQIHYQAADVSSPDDVAKLITKASTCLPHFTGLVNNAGIYGPKGRLEDTPWEEWRRAIEINLFGTVLPCRTAIPIFRRQGYGKIVNLSGGGATAPMPCLSAYAASKAAVVRLTETLAHETSGTGIDVNAIAPGALNTRLLDEVLAAGPERVGKTFHQKAMQQKTSGGVPLEKGAALVVYLLSRESDGITGRLLSAIWDPWPTLTGRISELQSSDVYTLRRIVPQDRGMNWEKS